MIGVMAVYDAGQVDLKNKLNGETFALCVAFNVHSYMQEKYRVNIYKSGEKG